MGEANTNFNYSISYDLDSILHESRVLHFLL